MRRTILGLMTLVAAILLVACGIDPTATPTPSPTPTTPPTPTFGEPQTLEVTAEQDATIYSDPDTFSDDTSGSISNLANGAGQWLLAGTTADSNVRRALVAFDLEEIPAGSEVREVSLEMYAAPMVLGRQEPVELYRLIDAWNEGPSDPPGDEVEGASAAPADVTWQRTGTGAMWDSNGGDYGSEIAAAIPVDDGGMTYSWRLSGRIIANVQDWVDNPSSNFGWLVISDERGTGTLKRFASREHPSQMPPTLEVTYAPPG